ncbi:hypothetical protein [Candidatus Puniceispirillum marinum]|uniref:Uroporphyrinogen-III synthetase n=1 Tax=Puniceispirillum marinum (strain IMCC1322) TaxID=488538 RepID=D5BQR4_PUNMI|nr:hypothetical protein [Candidatus Puniceispirillum marinum]ADE38628.1 uroporphyrinogen-III synthetase [Candidatus Puniceispirillum marinum IMCC1322]
MQFTYTPFGKLVEVQVVGNYYNIINEDGDSVSINHVKYMRSPEFLTKLQELVGHDVVYRSSVGNFSDGVYSRKDWFTDVFLDDGLSAGWPKEGDDQAVESLMDARLALRRAKQKAEADAAELEVMKTQLNFEKRIEDMGYTQFRKMLNTDKDFTDSYRRYVLWKNERGRTPQERETYPQDKKDFESLPPLIEQGFEWRVLGTLQSFVEDDNGTIKVVTSEATIYFAFPKHIYYRKLIADKLDLMLRQPVWALINDEDHTKDIRFIDITIHDQEDLDFLISYKSLIEIETQPELAAKLSARAERLTLLDGVVSEQAMEIQLLTPTDDELVLFFNNEIRPWRPEGRDAYIEGRKADPEFKRMYDHYKVRREAANGNNETLFLTEHPIKDVENYNWIELPAGFELDWNEEDDDLVVFYPKGDVRRWKYNANASRPTVSGVKAKDVLNRSMNRKLMTFGNLPIYMFANDDGEFVEVTLNDGSLEAGELNPLVNYEDTEPKSILDNKIRRFAMGKNQELADLEEKYEETERYNAGIPEDKRLQQEEWAEMVSDRIDELINAGKRSYLVVGMAVIESRYKHIPTHTDATLAVRCGINMSKSSKLIMAVHDQHYKNGKPLRNMVEATVYRNAKDEHGFEMTVALGLSDYETYNGEIFIPTAWDIGDSRLLSKLKKLGYKSEQRNSKKYPISYFLDLHKRAMELVRQEDRENLAGNK